MVFCDHEGVKIAVADKFFVELSHVSASVEQTFFRLGKNVEARLVKKFVLNFGV